MKFKKKCVGYLLVCLTLFEIVYTQGLIDRPCTLTSIKAPGVCKLLTDCKAVRDEIVQHQKLPQTCGFQGTQSIVCCPGPTMNKPRQPGDISRQKCKEYSSYARDRTNTECGHNIIKLTAGGGLASRNEFPHMAELGYIKLSEGVLQIRWGCGGSIISDQYVLTSAWCFRPRLGYIKYVRLGVSALNDTFQGQDIAVAERISHPEYSSSPRYHDIGLLKLEVPVKLTPYARPACLYLQKKITAEKAVATGWGRSIWAEEHSNNLLKVTVDLLDHDFCNNNSSSPFYLGNLDKGIVDDIQFCGRSGPSEKYMEKNICFGDFGGPLQIYHIGDEINCMYDIIGITSFLTISCSAGVYVRVSNYIQWIEDIVWPQ